MSKTYEYKDEEKKFPTWENTEIIDQEFMNQTRIIKSIQDSLAKESPSIIRQAQSEDIIVFLGNTRSGKSTLINYILGNKLKVIEDEDSFRNVIVKASDDVEDIQGQRSVRQHYQKLQFLRNGSDMRKLCGIARDLVTTEG